MINDLRAKLASSIKPLSIPDDLVWKRWLKPPSHSTQVFQLDQPGLQQSEHYDPWIAPALTEACEFYLRRVSILQRKSFDKFLRIQPTKPKHFALVQPKSHRLFFNLPASRISEKLFLDGEKQALVFTVFNSKTNVIPTVTKKIEIPDPQHSQSAYETIIQSFIVIENLLPAEYETVIYSTDQFDWIFKKYEALSRSIDFSFSTDNSLIGKQVLDSYFLEKQSISNDLLSSGTDTEITKEEALRKFFFGITKVSEELIAKVPSTYDISLLDLGSFDVSTYKLEHASFDEDSPKTYEYPIEKLDLTELVKVLRPSTQGLRIRENGFMGFPVNSIEQGSVSRNLLNQNLSNIFVQENGSIELDISRKSSSLPFIGKETIQRFNKVKIKSEDPENIPALCPPPDYQADFTDEPSKGLYEFQIQGVNLLINNSFALLADQSGLGKTVQAVSALGHLVKRKKIKSALIICNPSDIGRDRHELNRTIPDGWLGHLEVWAPELKTIVLSSDKSERIRQWNAQANIHIISYENLLFDEAEETIDFRRLKQFDCILLDNYLSFRLTSYQRDRIFQKLRPKYLWILDNSPIEEFESNIISYFINLVPQNKEKKSQESSGSLTDFAIGRSAKDLSEKFPKRVVKHRWFDLSEEQSRDYKVVLEQGQLKLYGSIERGNLFVIRPQIFTILHELMQVLNFPSSGSASSKVNTLIEDVQRISQHGKKAVVFSQYEKFGLKRLEELFTEHKINFVTYRAGMNNLQTEQVCRSFRMNKETTIFLADIKAVNKEMDLGDFDQILHFDQWWNPITLWLAEERICSTNRKHVLVQYFRTRGIIEEKIYEILMKKGVLNRLLIESLSQSIIADIISTEEWFELFELKFDKSDILTEQTTDFNDSIESIKECSSENFKNLTSSFLLKTGFAQLKELDFNSINNITTLEATKLINQRQEKVLIRLYHNHLVKEADILEFLGYFSKQKQFAKGVIITTGEFSTECSKYNTLKLNYLTLIDNTLLSSYLTQFKIM
ncbi:MAG: DEAD/DEAH box helicase [Bacteroidota bacterium]|nr:DEAD/DEAH box helicase [Bacteroidota bacterium]